MEKLPPSLWFTQCSAPRSLFPLDMPQEPDDANFETPGSLPCVLSWLGYYTEPTWEDYLWVQGGFLPILYLGTLTFFQFFFGNVVSA